MNALALALALASTDSTRADEVKLAPLPPRPTISRISTISSPFKGELIAMGSTYAPRTEIVHMAPETTVGIIFQ